MDLAYVFIYICMAAFAFSLLCIICCRSPGDAHPEEEGRAAALAQLAALMERARRLAAAAPALPVVKKELGYFPYSAAEEASGQRLVCAICLEVFVHGTACGEVPACRHFFHRDCIGMWMENGKNDCPLCRALIVPGAERLSAAEDIV
jgi:hypothetical protein